jgi:hypothetical protein
MVGVIAIAALIGLASSAWTQFTPVSDRTPAVLEGNWQSCREPDGHYSERVYDNTLPGIGPFELHLGPYHEFALFRGVQDEHRDHQAADNLLRPFNVEVVGNRARQSWAAAGLRLDVVLGGGASEHCESWFVRLQRASAGSSN